MSTRPVVVAEPREIVGKKVSQLRRRGILPAVVYGHGQASRPIQLGARDLESLIRTVGRNELLDLKIGGGKATPVLLQGIHEHPVRRIPIHADFFIVTMTEELTVDVPIHHVGESLAATKLGGTLLHYRESVLVRALPADLPSALELDITPLDSFDSVLYVSDLVVPGNVTVVTEATDPLVHVQQPRTDEGAEPTAAGETPTEGAGPTSAAETGSAQTAE